MTGWSGADVAEALGLSAGSPIEFVTVSTDTRTLVRNALFVALRGDRFDGHDYLEAARQAGATGAVVRRGTGPVDGLRTFEVADPLRALGALARARRRRVAGPVVAVTGTNGKTTTKEMLRATLASRWTVHATEANLNNLIGVPLTVLAGGEDVDALVIEAGANQPGEIATLRDIVEPTIGVVTNVAEGHLAGFGSLDGVLSEKVSLLRGVPFAVVGTEPPELATAAREVAERVVTAGLDPKADVHPESYTIEDGGRVRLSAFGTDVLLPVAGRHQGDNASIALAVAQAAGVDGQTAMHALDSVRVPGGRCEVLQIGGLTVLNDAYNANPASLAAALETVARVRSDRRLVVLVGSMLELGSDAEHHHRVAAGAIRDIEPDLVGATGDFVDPLRALDLGARLVVADDAEALGRAVAGRLDGTEVVLVKASRGVGLDRAIPFLTPTEGEPCSTTS